MIQVDSCQADPKAEAETQAEEEKKKEGQAGGAEWGDKAVRSWDYQGRERAEEEEERL